MRLNVLPTDIGQGGVVAMRFRVQNECSLSTMASFAEQTRAEVEPQLHRHVEPRQAAGADLDARKIVDAPVALPDHRSDLADPNLGAVSLIQRAAGIITRSYNNEHHRAQKRLELVVKGAIDEDGLGRRLRPRPARHGIARTSSAGRRG